MQEINNYSFEELQNLNLKLKIIKSIFNLKKEQIENLKKDKKIRIKREDKIFNFYISNCKIKITCYIIPLLRSFEIFLENDDD